MKCYGAPIYWSWSSGAPHISDRSPGALDPFGILNCPLKKLREDRALTFSDLIFGIVWVTSVINNWSMVSKVTVNQLKLAELPKRSQITKRRTLVFSLPEVSGVDN